MIATGVNTSSVVMPPPAAEEHADYHACGSEQLYLVHYYPAAAPQALVLCCPPFGLERTLAYTTLVRFARFLAHQGFEVIRFDYRGTGESSGRFEDCGFEDWERDSSDILMAVTAGISVPRLLFGLRFGALIASRLYGRGLGEALLSWEPLTDARTMLLDLLRRKLAASILRGDDQPSARNCQSYIDAWLKDGTLEVDGQRWGKALWIGSANFQFDTSVAQDGRPRYCLDLLRPSHHASLAGEQRATLRIPTPPFWHYGPEILPDLQTLFDQSLAFLCSTVAHR